MAEKYYEAYYELMSIDWKINSTGPAFLDPEEASKQKRNAEVLLKCKYINKSDYNSVIAVIDYGFNNYLNTSNLKNRRIGAQKFIAKKNIRRLIFNRDFNKCLRCGHTERLSLDHIVPINKNGQNKIMNLQTLCTSCNSWKSDKAIDFRPGARVLNYLLK